MRRLGIALLPIAFAAPVTAAELIINGDFEAGNASFRSNYAYVAPAGAVLQPGQYTVAANARSVNPAFASYRDKSTGSGLYLVVNGAVADGGLVWRQSVDVVEGAEYKFKGYISAASALNPAFIEVKASFDGRPPEFLGRFTPPAGVGDWLGIEAGFKATGRLLTISIFDTTAGSDGNDFGLDDLRLVGPAPAPPLAASGPAKQ